MTWADLRAWFSAIGDLLTGLAAVGAVWAAFSWRKQRRHERVAEVAGPLETAHGDVQRMQARLVEKLRPLARYEQ